VLALLAALLASQLWGVSDFLGGLAARTAGVLRSTTIAYGAAAALLVVGAVVLPAARPGPAIAVGAVAGLANAVGFIAFYAAFAAGSMGVVSTGVALVQSVVPVVVAVALQGAHLGALAWVGIVAAITGGLMLGLPTGAEPPLTGRALGFTVLSGAAFGTAVVTLDAAPDDGGLLPMTAQIVVGLALLGSWLALARRWTPAARAAGALDPPGAAPAPSNAATRTALAGGVLLALADSFLLLALRHGDLAVVAVVIALYPVGTAVLARLVLHEHLTRRQVTGIAVALAACALLSLA
jgi:drug/metabolite transporter (DMT)-like permease